MDYLKTILSFGCSLPLQSVKAFSYVKKTIVEMDRSKKISIVGAAAIAVIAIGIAYAEKTSSINYLKTPATRDWPFSDAVLIRGFNVDTLHLSGKMGTDANGTIVSGGIEAETFQAMTNIKTTVEGFGWKMQDIFECKVMIVDMKNWPLFNKIYTLFFDSQRLPARSAFGVADLALGGKVEVTCQAARAVSLVGKMQYLARTLLGR